MQIINIFIEELQGAFSAFGNGITSGSLDSFIEGLTALIWSPLTVLLLLGAGLYFSIRLRFVQVRQIKTMVKLLMSGGSSDEGISSFQAFALAVAGRVGTGNIMGVATAIAYGGPGALFWMWLIAFIGAGSAFVESTLAQLYKVEIDGQYRGGPAYYFGMRGHKLLSIVFMIACIIATGLLLPGIQANSIVTSIHSAFNIQPIIIALIIIVLIALIIFGGTKRLGRVAEIVVPFMSGIYILASIIILLMNITQIPAAFGLIFRSAFGQDAVLGAALGQAIMMGVKRGIFSNEAGQGTGPHAAAAAEVSHPVKQGLVQAFSVYFDTLLVCSATGLAIIITGAYSIFIPGTGDANGLFHTFAGYSMMGSSPDLIPTFTSQAFSYIMGDFAPKFIGLAIFFFAFTTLMAVYYYAESNLELLFEKKTQSFRKSALLGLRILFLLAILYFGLTSNTAAWNVADIGVGVMAIINVIGILMIGKPAFISLLDFEKKQKEGLIDQPFKLSDIPSDLQDNFRGVTFWKDENINKKYK